MQCSFARGIRLQIASTGVNKHLESCPKECAIAPAIGEPSWKDRHGGGWGWQVDHL